MTTAATRSRAGTQASAAAEKKEPAGKKEPAAKPEKKETVQQLKNRLRNEAEREVLDKHKKEVIARTKAKYDAHGLKYVRRLTDEEKAAKAIQENLAKYPNLRSQFIATDPDADVVRVQTGSFSDTPEAGAEDQGPGEQ